MVALCDRLAAVRRASRHAPPLRHQTLCLPQAADEPQPGQFGCVQNIAALAIMRAQLAQVCCSPGLNTGAVSNGDGVRGSRAPFSESACVLSVSLPVSS